MRGLIGGGTLTFLGAIAGASSVGVVATSSGSSAAAGAAIGLAAVIGTLTGLGVALRTRCRSLRAESRRAVLDILATLVALVCMVVSVTAVIASTAPPPR